MRSLFVEYDFWNTEIANNVNPADNAEWFEDYFENGIIRKPLQYHVPKIYPSTEKGVSRWNTQVKKFNLYNEFLTMTKSGNVISVPTLFKSIVAILSSKNDDDIVESDLDNLSSIIGLLDNYSDLSEAEKGCLYKCFSDKETVLSLFNGEIRSSFDKPEGEIEITSDICKKFIDALNTSVSMAIQEAKDERKKITSSNTDVVLEPDEDENPNQDKVEKGTNDQSKVPFETLNTVNEGVWNQNLINSAIPPYIPAGANPLILKISAILNLLRSKGIIIRGQYISNPGDYSANLQSMKISNQYGDTIIYTENDKLVFYMDGVSSEFSLGGCNTKVA